MIRLNPIYELLSGCILLMLVTSCHAQRNPHDNVLNLSLSERVSSLDPTRAYDEVSLKVANAIYESPLQYRYESSDTSQLEPLLLSEMPSIEDQGRKFTLRLKKDIRYQPDECFSAHQSHTRTVTSDDLGLALLRLLDPAVQSSGHWIVANRLVGDEGFLKATSKAQFTNWKERLDLYAKNQVQGLQTIDAHTLTISFREPYPQFLYILAMTFLAPMPAEALQFYGEDIERHPVGTGPFRLESWKRGSQVLLHRNESYWGDKPDVEQARYEIILESQPAWLKFLRGELDAIAIPKDNYSNSIDKDGALRKEFKSEGVKLYTGSLPIVWFIGFNMQDPIVGKDIALRKAIMYAYDSEKRIRLLTNNRALRATTILPPGIPGHQQTAATPPQRNFREAKKWLARSHYVKRSRKPKITYDIRGNSTIERQWGEMFKQDMEKLGVNIRIQLNNFPDYLEKERKGRLQVFMGGWVADYPNAENVLQLLYSKNRPPGPNATSYSNRSFDALFDDLRLTLKPEKRLKLIEEMVSKVRQDLPWIADFYSTSHVLTHRWIKNYKIHPFIQSKLKYLKLAGSKTASITPPLTRSENATD